MRFLKKVLGIIVIVGVIAGAFLARTYLRDGSSEAQGELVLQLTDAPPELNIENVFVTISEVKVHKAEENVQENLEENVGENVEESESGTWYTVNENTQQFDLKAIEDVSVFLGSATLEVGKYSQIRLKVENASVISDGNEYQLTIPSNTQKLVNAFDIEENATTTLTLDFDAGESIHKTGNNDYIMRPTIRVLEE